MRLARDRLTAARAFRAPRALAARCVERRRVFGGDEGLGLLRRPCRRSRRRRPGWSMRTPWPTRERNWSISAGARGRDALRLALELTQKCGATALAECGRGDLGAGGERPPRLELSGVDP
jgi:hypothetical protein